MDFAALPGVYMDTTDDAVTPTTSDSNAARGRDSANDSGHTSLSDGEPSHQGYPAYAQYSSTAASMSSVDPKLLKLCVVALDRCVIQKSEPVPLSEPVSCVAMLKSVKNIYSVDVLRSSPASCAPAVAGSARQLTAAAHIPAPTVRVGSRGISSILAHDIVLNYMLYIVAIDVIRRSKLKNS